MLRKTGNENGTNNGQMSGQTSPEIEIDKEIDIDKEFEKWYNLYDYKKSKEKAIKSWSKLKNDDKKKCLEVVVDYVKSTPDKQYRKHPSTYLNQKCWNDEIIMPKESLEAQKEAEKQKEIQRILNE